MELYGTNCCDARWGGLLTCHCAACHNTFSNIKNFDAHRSRGKCLDPQKAGLLPGGREYPVWVSQRPW